MVEQSEFKELKPTYNEILTERYVNKLTYKKIADKLGITLNAVKKRLYNARRKLPYDWTYLGNYRVKL